MVRISNLCSIIAIALLIMCAAPTLAQQRTEKFARMICGDLTSLIEYLNENNYSMTFMGSTTTNNIFDSLWIKENEYTIVRANKTNSEACILSNGTVAWSDYVQGESL